MLETEFGYFIGSEEITLIGPKAVTNNTLIYVEPQGTIQHIVPDGFVYDGASIPKFAWSLVGHPFMRRYRRPAALHDYHCRFETVSSRKAHFLFYLALRSEGVPVWRAQVLYRAVQLFGPKFEARTM